MHFSMNTTATLDFCLALSRSARVLSRRSDGRLGSLHGISFADLAILLTLGRAPGGRLRRIDLADQLGLTASAVTRALMLPGLGLVLAERGRRIGGKGRGAELEVREPVTRPRSRSGRAAAAGSSSARVSSGCGWSPAPTRCCAAT